MATITVGPEAINRASTGGWSFTVVDTTAPSDGSGIIDTVKVWAAGTSDGVVKVGLFYRTTGDNLTCRSWTTLAGWTTGGLKTFSGLSLAVEVGDYIGLYQNVGAMGIDRADSGGGSLSALNDNMGCVNTPFSPGVRLYSLRGEGATIETPTVSPVKIDIGRSPLLGSKTIGDLPLSN